MELDRPQVAAVVIGAFLLFAAPFLPLTGSGVGSTVPAHQVGDLVLSGVVAGWVPRWVGAVVYLLPIGGATALLAAGLGGRAGRVLGWVSIVAALVGTLLPALALRWSPFETAGRGFVAAAAGTAALVGERIWSVVRARGRRAAAPAVAEAAPVVSD